MSLDVLKAVLDCFEHGKQAVLATVVEVKGSAPREAGAKMLVNADGGIVGTIGGGTLEASTIREAGKLMEEQGNPKLVNLVLSGIDMGCGGSAMVFLEPVNVQARLLIFGAGHLGLEIASFASRLGFRITVVDDRMEWATRERFKEPVRLLVKPFDEAIEILQPGEKDLVVIVTRGHDYDQTVLEACIGKNPAYLGMVGSRKKVKTALDKLRERGTDEELIARIRSPIGLDLGGRTPAEIALSIMAEIVAFQNGRDDVRPMSRTTGSSHPG
ncbi:MAG: hypothetical protein GXP49_09745 [Deltaproteobacteria bacterium]|nr:hypothetical protein [Deltaproteobacteria bacterium]